MSDDAGFPTVTHWGAYHAEVEDGRVVAMRPVDDDPNPSSLADSMPGAQDDSVRISQPMVRQGYLEHGPGGDSAGRGSQPFVAVSWDEAFDLVAAELKRVREDHGNQAIYAGSYGWSSAGRFHHAQSQLHRFLNCFGGYTSSKDSYSYAAGEVILPHVLGPFQELLANHTSWPTIAKHGELVVSFGGLPVRNGQVSSGGTGKHVQKEGLLACRKAGIDFVLIGPMRDDMEDALEAEWLAARPNTDVAIMLGLAHTIWSEGLHDTAFLDRHCVGFEKFLPYLSGDVDGQPKDADWAAGISEIPADTIRALARRMAASRTTLALSWSLTRGHHGEQPFWMGTVLAAMLGQIGLPGGGHRVWLQCGQRHWHGNRQALLAVAFTGTQSGRELHSGRAHIRAVAQSKRDDRLQRSARHLPGCEAGLLGRRQSVPSSSGPQSPGEGVAAARHHDQQ